MAAETGPVQVSWSEIHDEARAVGAALQARGLVPGDHVAILGPTSRELITIIRGCWMAGLASMVLPLPMRMGSLDVFIDSTRGRILHGDAKLLLIDDLLADFYSPADGDPPILPMKAIMPGAANVPSGDALEIPAHDPEHLVILQYTSGSTSEPKGVMIPDRVLSANIDACAEAAELNSDDAMVSWLPLYHDMGLVGFLALPMTKGVDLVVNWPWETSGAGKFDFTFVANWNDTEVTKVPATEPLAALNPPPPLFARVNVLTFEEGTPQDKYAAIVNWSLDRFGATARATRYGEVLDPGTTEVLDVQLGSATLFDLEGRFDVTERIRVALGAENVFEEYPDAFPISRNTTGNTPFSNYSPFGRSGRFIYGRVSIGF